MCLETQSIICHCNTYNNFNIVIIQIHIYFKVHFKYFNNILSYFDVVTTEAHVKYLPLSVIVT